jgi:hypothetical protein
VVVVVVGVWKGMEGGGGHIDNYVRQLRADTPGLLRSSLAFSGDGALLCSTDKRAAGGNVAIWDMAASPTLKSEGWVFHSAVRVHSPF